MSILEEIKEFVEMEDERPDLFIPELEDALVGCSERFGGRR